MIMIASTIFSLILVESLKLSLSSKKIVHLYSSKYSSTPFRLRINLIMQNLISKSFILTINLLYSRRLPTKRRSISIRARALEDRLTRTLHQRFFIWPWCTPRWNPKSDKFARVSVALSRRCSGSKTTKTNGCASSNSHVSLTVCTQWVSFKVMSFQEAKRWDFHLPDLG